MKRRVAFVVQRYGADVTGGSESLARAVAERLATEDEVVVFTTTARDYVTWRNEFVPGVERLAGVEVRRFATEEHRDLAAFNAFSDGLYGAASRSRDDELEWLRRQGPYAPRLVEALAADRERFDAFVFFTYLYHPTYWGLREVGDRALLVPTTHDEPPLAFSIYDEVFARARGFVFLTPAERALVERRFGVGERPGEVAGIGIDPPGRPDAEAFAIRHDLLRPYAVYAGRIDAGKGCAEMLDFHERYRRRHAGGVDLVLLGRLALPDPRGPGVRLLGFVPESDKQAALAGARAVICPSPYESLSIVLLEGMALGVPALVSARSDVLVEHCRRSQAGLYYADADEFAESLDLLDRLPRLRAALGDNGRRYVDEVCRWDRVLGAYRRLIDGIRG